MALRSVAEASPATAESFPLSMPAGSAYFEHSSMTTIDREEFERLQHQATRLERLLQVMPAGVVVIDGRGIVKQANAQARALLGEPLESMIWRDIIARSFKPQADDGHEVSLHDGRKVKLSITPLVDEPGQLIVITDLTETRQLQQRISHMQRLSSLGKTVASLVHQIRTPLSAAMLYASNLASKSLGQDARDKFAAKLLSRLGELESQVNDMLLFAKSGEQQVVEHITLTELVADVEKGAEAMVCQQHATLSVDLDGQSSQTILLGNRIALTGALQNLIHNALQAQSQHAQIHLNVTLSEDSSKVIFTVSDNGPGIPQEALAHIFEPFYTSRSQGTGLGLAVVQSVIRSHRGEVQVRNQENGGAEFTLFLPVAIGDATPSAPQTTPVSGAQ